MDWRRYDSSSTGNAGGIRDLINSNALQILSDSAKERRQRLIEGVLFSGRFILTYQIVLIGVLLLFTARQMFVRLIRSQRHRYQTASAGQTARQPHDQRDIDREGSTSSSSSSTLIVMDNGAKDHGDEQSPLLGNETHKPPRSFWRSLHAVSMYQPPSIPVVNKNLPSNSTSVMVLLMVGLNAFYSLYNIRFEEDQAFVFSDRTARLFVANLPWLYLLAAKNQPIRLMTGYSYENLNILHRRLGEILCFLAILHGVFMIMTWYTFFRPTGMDIWHFLGLKIIVLGLLALASYELLFLTSLASFRAWWYEGFLACHIVLQAAGLILVYFHHRNGRVYTAVTLAIFLVDRIVFRVMAKTRSVRADLKLMEDGETVLVSADWPVTTRWRNIWTSVTGISIRHGWLPTEHVFLTVPSMARKHIIQAHPFTIASAAPEGSHTHAWFNLIIRAHNGFSRDLLQYAHSRSSTNIRIDGPYGSLHALDMMRHSDVALVVVGGSGIAVAYPLIWTLLRQDQTDSETGGIGKKVGLIWIVHEASHIAWIGQERLDELDAMGLHIRIPPPTSKAGRPDASALACEFIHDLTKGVQMQDPRIGVVVSGPDTMNRAVRNTCASMAWEGYNIDVAVEKYGW